MGFTDRRRVHLCVTSWITITSNNPRDKFKFTCSIEISVLYLMNKVNGMLIGNVDLWLHTKNLTSSSAVQRIMFCFQKFSVFQLFFLSFSIYIFNDCDSVSRYFQTEIVKTIWKFQTDFFFFKKTRKYC